MKRYSNGRARRKAARRQREKVRRAWRGLSLGRKFRFALYLAVRYVFYRAAQNDAAHGRI